MLERALQAAKTALQRYTATVETLHVGFSHDALPGTATDYGIATPGLDLAFKLYILE